MQRVQNQICRLIVRVVAAMPKKQARLVKTAYRKAQHIAHRFQAALGFVKQIGLGRVLPVFRLPLQAGYCVIHC